MIAIAGGSGRLGSLVVRRLVERDLDVRVITRDPARAAHLRDLRVEIVTADVRDAARTRAALEGRTPSSPLSTASRDPAESRLNRSIVTGTPTSWTPRRGSGSM